MAQKIVKDPTTTGQLLTVASWGIIPGLSITVLNASGWLDLIATLTLVNTLAGANTAYARFTCDGAALTNSTRQHSYAAVATLTLALRHAIKPGAGQHIYTVEGFAASANVNIYNLQAQFELNEPGY